MSKTQYQAKAAVSRRGFIAGGAVATGALAAGLAATQAQAEEATTNEGAKEALAQIKPAIGHVVHNPDICSGCRTCEIICAVAHDGVASSELSRMQWKKNIFDACITDIMTCKQCDGPECLAACPTGALHVDETTGARVIDETQCIGCQSCLNACPADPSRIRFNLEKNVSFKCDLCGGDPQCVKFCPTGALTSSWLEYNFSKEDDDFVKNFTGDAAPFTHMEKSNVVLSDVAGGIHMDGVIWTSHATQFNIVMAHFEITADLYDASGNVIASAETPATADIPEMQSAEFALDFATSSQAADVAKISMNVVGTCITNAPDVSDEAGDTGQDAATDGAGAADAASTAGQEG